MARRDFEDDGRTIADMSGVERRNLLLPRRPPREEPPAPAREESEPSSERPWEEKSMSRQDRRAYILAALGSALAIAAVFAVVLGLAIFLITKLHG